MIVSCPSSFSWNCQFLVIVPDFMHGTQRQRVCVFCVVGSTKASAARVYLLLFSQLIVTLL